jgi:hypothetical protein
MFKCFPLKIDLKDDNFLTRIKRIKIFLLKNGHPNFSRCPSQRAKLLRTLNLKKSDENLTFRFFEAENVFFLCFHFHLFAINPQLQLTTAAQLPVIPLMLESQGQALEPILQNVFS